jgi:hypothetical protein
VEWLCAQHFRAQSHDDKAVGFALQVGPFFEQKTGPFPRAPRSIALTIVASSIICSRRQSERILSASFLHRVGLVIGAFLKGVASHQQAPQDMIDIRTADRQAGIAASVADTLAGLHEIERAAEHIDRDHFDQVSVSLWGEQRYIGEFMDVSCQLEQSFVCPLILRFSCNFRGHSMTVRVEGHSARTIPVELDWLYIQRFDKLAKCFPCLPSLLPESCPVRGSASPIVRRVPAAGLWKSRS